MGFGLLSGVSISGLLGREPNNAETVSLLSRCHVRFLNSYNTELLTHLGARWYCWWPCIIRWNTFAFIGCIWWLQTFWWWIVIFQHNCTYNFMVVPLIFAPPSHQQQWFSLIWRDINIYFEKWQKTQTYISSGICVDDLAQPFAIILHTTNFHRYICNDIQL